jgi:hypothetical protein
VEDFEETFAHVVRLARVWGRVPLLRHAILMLAKIPTFAAKDAAKMPHPSAG